MKFLILGCNGMAGHMLSIYLKEQGHSVLGFARKKSEFVEVIVGDARNFDLLKMIVTNNDFDAIINCETFYDRTKALGELVDDKNVTLRNSIIGPDINVNGIGLMNWFLKQNSSVKGFKKAIWTGQTTLQLAKTVEQVAYANAKGLFNTVPDYSISKYELLQLFNKYIRKNEIEIIPEENFSVDKSLVRLNYEGFDYRIPDYETMIIELAEWMKAHREMYSYYDIAGEKNI